MEFSNKHQFNDDSFMKRWIKVENELLKRRSIKRKEWRKFLYRYSINKINQILKPKLLTNEQKIQMWKFKTKFKNRILNKIKSIEDSFLNVKIDSGFTATESKKLTLYNNIKKFSEGELKKKKIVDKINSHSMKNGNKQTSEKNFLKSIKLLQKKTNKQTNELIKLSILFSTPLFKIHKIEKKKQKNKSIKEIPRYMGNSGSRTSLAIKFIISICKQKKLPTFAECFSEEILLNAQKKGVAVQKKNDLQEKVLKNEKYTKSYRWK